MSRFVPDEHPGRRRLKPLNITAVVQPDRSFTMHFQLGMPGTYGYSVGYPTAGTSPELVAFQFQFTTTGSGKPAPSTASSTAVQLKGKKLSAAGFTKKPNVVGWGGTAAISTSKAKAGAPVTISGTAPAELRPARSSPSSASSRPTRRAPAHFEPVGSTSTVVKADGTFELTFEVNQPGRYGYTLGAGLNEEWIGIEFQLKTT